RSLTRDLAPSHWTVAPSRAAPPEGLFREYDSNSIEEPFRIALISSPSLLGPSEDDVEYNRPARPHVIKRSMKGWQDLLGILDTLSESADDGGEQIVARGGRQVCADEVTALD